MGEGLGFGVYIEGVATVLLVPWLSWPRLSFCLLGPIGSGSYFLFLFLFTWLCSVRWAQGCE